MAIVGAGYFVLPEAFDAIRTFQKQGEDASALAEYQLRRVSADEYVRQIDQAIAEGDVELAASIKALAVSQAVPIPIGVQDRIDAAAAAEGGVAHDVWDGITTGEAKGWAGFSAAVVSDFIVIGDLRDLAKEAAAYPDYDPLVVALAATGVALTGLTAGTMVGTLLTGGAAAPSIGAVGSGKVGVSVLKAARKMGKLDPRLAEELTSLARKSIDGEKLGSLAGYARRLDWDGLVAATGKVVRREAVNQLSTGAEALGTVAKKQGYRATVQTLGAARSTQEVQRLGRLSEKFPAGYRGLLTLVPTAAGALVWGSSILLTMASWAVSGVFWLLGTAYFLFRMVRFAVRAARRRRRLAPQGVTG